jgi:signal transduction histidine kinase
MRLGQGESALLALTRPIQASDPTLWIQVSQDFGHRDALVDDIAASFLRKVGWIVVPALALLLAIDLLIFRRALRPLVQASALAARIGPSTTDIRLPSAGLPKELAPLIAAINQALDRLEQGFRAQREFTADAAHELRTPLAVLKTHVDLLDDKQVAATLRQDIDTMGRLVEQMLDIAEVDSLVVAAGERADLRAVCVDVATFLAPLALKCKRDIAVTGVAEPVWVRGNNEALFHAVANLTENALRHTPADTTVELEVGADGQVRVLDEGPGVPEAERSLVFRRFWRRDRRSNTSTGLGLAIVSRIVEAHGGRIAVADRPPRGAAFTLDLSTARLPTAA